MKDLLNNRGSAAVVTALVLVTLAGISIIAISRLADAGQRQGISNRRLQELATLQHMLLTNVDCCKSLGVDETTSLPLNCDANTNYLFKDATGKPLTTAAHTLGTWTLKTQCGTEGLVVKRNLTSQYDSFKIKGYDQERELFNPSRELCKECFQTNSYDACCGQPASSPTPSPSPTVCATLPADGHLIFVTSSIHDGDLGGLAGANAICQNLAVSVGLRPTATWKAVLSTSALDARDAIQISGPVYNLRNCGTVVAADEAQFWGNGDWSDYALCHENGDCNWYSSQICRNVLGPSDILVGHGGYHTWTGTYQNGTAHNQNCNDWTSADGSQRGAAGDAHDKTRDRMVDGSWAIHRCDAARLRLYCISQ